MTEQPPTYHALNRSERDHLLAVAQLDGNELVCGQDVQEQVEHIRQTDRPSNPTTYTTLQTLADMGLISRELVTGNTANYGLTLDGDALLADGCDEFLDE